MTAREREEGSSESPTVSGATPARARPNNPAGRPSSYSPEIASELLAYVRAGDPTWLACRKAGVPSSTLYRWLKSHPDFDREMRKADGHRVGKRLQKLEDAGTEDWRSHAWLAERTTPELREVRVAQVEIARGVQQVLEAVRDHMSEGAYDELVTALATVEGLDLIAGDAAQESSEPPQST